MKTVILLLLSSVLSVTIDNVVLRPVHAEQLPTIKQIYEENGIQKKVDIQLPLGYENIKPESKGRVYFLEDDKEESIIADIEVLSITKNGIAHATITGKSASIRIESGYYVKFLLPPQVADTIVPTGSIGINNHSAYTNSRMVTLGLSATDNIGITGYYISTSPTPPSANANGWQSVVSSKSYSENVSYTMDSGDGNKTVYVWHKDAAGNISASANDSIVLDTTAPTISITSPTFDSTYTTTTSPISIGGMASDSTSGIRSVRWSNNKRESWLVNGTTNWSIPGVKLWPGSSKITVTAIDNAGNENTDSITVIYNPVIDNTKTYCQKCKKEIGEGHLCDLTTYCQHCKEEVGYGHICDLTFFCHDCKKEVGDGHICGVTSFCTKCEEEVGTGHICDVTYFCYDCEKEVGEVHECGKTFFCFDCGKEVPKDHDHSKTKDKPTTQSYDSKKVLATVNGENITQEDVDKILNRFENQVNKEQISAVTKQIFDGLITQKLVMQFIRDNKIEASQFDINAELNKVRNDIKSNPSLNGQTLEQVLESHGSTIEELRRDIIISLSLEKYLGKGIDGMQQNVKQNMMEEKAQLLIKQLREKAKIKYFTQ